MLDQLVVEADHSSYHRLMLIGCQIGAARALLRMSAAELASRADVSIATLKRAEATDGVPTITALNLSKIENALDAAGVIFLSENQLAPGGPGVRLKSKP